MSSCRSTDAMKPSPTRSSETDHGKDPALPRIARIIAVMPATRTIHRSMECRSTAEAYIDVTYYPTENRRSTGWAKTISLVRLGPAGIMDLQRTLTVANPTNMMRFFFALAVCASAVFSMGMTSKPEVASSSSSVGGSASTFEVSAWQDVQLGAVKANVFAMALHAAATAVERGDVGDPGTLTIIDFSQPSTARRMWVYDLRSRTLLFEDLVSHGRGELRDCLRLIAPGDVGRHRGSAVRVDNAGSRVADRTAR